MTLLSIAFAVQFGIVQLAEYECNTIASLAACDFLEEMK